MQYKTIALELLERHPELHHRLRASRILLQTVELSARELKASHEAWKERLSRASPTRSEGQVASESLELALRELEELLAQIFPVEGTEPPSLSAAIAYVRGRSRPA